MNGYQRLAIAIEGHQKEGLTKEGIEKILPDLEKSELDVIKLRYGLDTDVPLKREEVAEKLKITMEQTEKLEASAITKLRHPSRIKIAKEQ